MLCVYIIDISYGMPGDIIQATFMISFSTIEYSIVLRSTA